MTSHGTFYSTAGLTGSLRQDVEGGGSLEGHPKQNINLRGAIIHTLGDLAQSIGLAIAGALIWWKQVWSSSARTGHLPCIACCAGPQPPLNERPEEVARAPRPQFHNRGVDCVLPALWGPAFTLDLALLLCHAQSGSRFPTFGRTWKGGPSAWRAQPESCFAFLCREALGLPWLIRFVPLPLQPLCSS